MRFKLLVGRCAIFAVVLTQFRNAFSQGFDAYMPLRLLESKQSDEAGGNSAERNDKFTARARTLREGACVH